MDPVRSSVKHKYIKIPLILVELKKKVDPAGLVGCGKKIPCGLYHVPEPREMAFYGLKYVIKQDLLFPESCVILAKQGYLVKGIC